MVACVCCRNAATDTVEQELLFVGQEAGKLIAMRDIVRKVSTYVHMLIYTWYMRIKFTCVSAYCYVYNCVVYLDII